LIGYVRVSRVAGREGERFISPDVQRERIEKQAAAGGHTLVDWFEDLDQPGSKRDRPGFQAALEAVEAGAADGVIVARLDRFARSLSDAVQAIQRLNDAGGQLVSVEDGFDSSTHMGRFAVHMLLALAELELGRIRENWSAAAASAIRRGVHICRVPPAGYLRGEDGRLEVDPVAGPVIRELFQRRGAGASWDKLCRFLDERLQRPDGGHWARSTVSSLVGRRAYLGEARQGDLVNVDAHPPLVTRGEFESAQLATADGRRGRGPDGGALLAGIVRCAGCGHALTRVAGGRRGYRNYKCRKRNSDGVCAAPAGISVARADAHVESEFFAWLEREPLRLGSKSADAALEEAVAAAEAAEAELVAYRDGSLISVIGRDAYVAGLSERQQRVDDARRRLGEANASAPLSVEHRDLRAVWPNLEVRERRHLLASVIEKIAVTATPGAGRGGLVADRLAIIWR